MKPHSQIAISQITFEHSRDGLVDTSKPRISWRFEGFAKDWYQISFDIRLKRDSVTEEFHVDTSKSSFVPWPSTPLKSREIVEVSIKSNGRDGIDTLWVTSQIEATLLEASDWKADVISISHSSQTDPKTPARPFLVNKEFHVDNVKAPARLYSTSLGMYDIKLNGQTVGAQVLKPGWTSYDHRLYYQCFDVSSLLKIGTNVIEGHVAEGWYSGRLGFLGGGRKLWGENNGLLAQLMMGHEMVVKTDASWIGSLSHILSSEIYDGEVVDASLIGAQPEKLPVIILDKPKGKLILDKAPMTRIQEVSAKEIIITSNGKKIVDFGQNLVGWIRINTAPRTSSPGAKIIFSHAEVLEQGELGTRPLRIAKCQDTIILGSDNSVLHNWEPSFTFHGFRYLQVDGWTEDIELGNFTAIVVHTDMERTGWFSSSHPMINQLHENVVWGMRGNFVGLPTDCPQRDERLGWTGDLTVFNKTANFLYDTSSMITGWLQDVAHEQKENDGVPPLVVPDVISKTHPDDVQSSMRLAIWGDITVLGPLSMYEAFGDSQVLAEQYESMYDWLTKGICRGEDGLWDTTPGRIQLGDWLDPAAPPDHPGDGRTDPFLVADAYLCHVTRTMAQISRLLNKEEDAARFENQWKDLRQKYLDNYVSKYGRTVSDSQTALALSLHFDLLESSQRKVAINRLEQLVRKNVFKVATGFAGTPIILDVLAANDRLSLAYRMLQDKQCPSWLYTVSMGATTMWERWDSMRPDGTINPGEMTSFNHYALGAVASFLHETIGGLKPLEAGWKKFIIAPRPGGTVASAEVKHLSPYGLIKCSWRIESRRLIVQVAVPPNTRAKIDIGELQTEVGSGDREFIIDYQPDPSWPPEPVYNSMTVPLIDEIA